MQASERFLDHAGGAWNASLNHYDTGGGCMLTTQQIDEWEFVVGQEDFRVARYHLAEWLREHEQLDPPFIEAEDAVEAWELLRVVRDDCFLWQREPATPGSTRRIVPESGCCGVPHVASPESTSGMR